MNLTLRRAASACVLALSALAAAPAAAQQARPNILLIVTDDQAPWAMGADREGHPQLRTPHIDRLVREGAHLPNSFTVNPVCSPSRAGMMTSRYGSELGITDWIHPMREPGLGLAPETVTWSEVLQQSGYATGLVGKWHLGLQPRHHPTRTGFGYFMGFLGGGNRVTDPMLETGGVERRVPGFTTDILTDSAIAFVQANRSRPFLLAVHYRAPHSPWLPLRDEDWAPYRDLDPTPPHPDYPGLDVPRLQRMTREYLGSVASVDRSVGRILRTLDETGLAENTIVIFTSDHGYNMGHNGIWHKGNGHWVVVNPPEATNNIPEGQRPNLYDHSLRVPTAVRWPGRIRPGTVVERTVSNLDWYPTLLAMGGAEVPAGALVRGRDLLPLLLGANPPGWDDDLYAEYSTHHQSWTHMRGYRTPEWKLVRDYLNPGRDELYDLVRDPGETTNLIDSADPAARRAADALDARILQRMRELNDPVLDLARARAGASAADR